MRLLHQQTLANAEIVTFVQFSITNVVVCEKRAGYTSFLGIMSMSELACVSVLYVAANTKKFGMILTFIAGRKYRPETGLYIF